MLLRGRRSPDQTAVRRDLGLVLRRALVGASFAAASGALALAVGGWAWALAGVLAIPAAFTLASIRRPFVAPCPGCGALLGGALVQLPDEPVLGPIVHDLRCAACGIYVDASGGVVREVPFRRTLESPGFECGLAAEHLAALQWGADCVRCGHPATRALRLSTREAGVISGLEATLDGAPDGAAPGYCAEHGAGDDPMARALVVARTPGRVTVQLSLYAAYRAFLDANRDAVDVAVRSGAVHEPPAVGD
jgi:hypothetical protein